MPELPEVETITMGLKPHLEGKILNSVIVRESKLRWPISANLIKASCQKELLTITRRGKYMLFRFVSGTLIIHLGMSGRLVLYKNPHPACIKHDHVDFLFQDNLLLRYNDPRRFGSILWTTTAPEQHKLIMPLGVEPLTTQFSADYLFKKCSASKSNIKLLLMNAKIVVGVGNIYANEALFYAKIDPRRIASSLSYQECKLLVSSTKRILKLAIKAGGTTIKDFANSTGKPGYFINNLAVYGQGTKPCKYCQSILKEIRLNQRSTVYCPKCQN